MSFQREYCQYILVNVFPAGDRDQLTTGVDQDLQLTEPRLLILTDPQADAAGDSFLSWDDLIGQR